MKFDRLGISYAICAYVTWGLFPIYWKFLIAVSPLEILSHRVIWSAILLLAIVLCQKYWREFSAICRQPSRLLPLLASATILAFNWGLYIYGVNSDRVVETSLGYFINPLVSVLLGVVLLGERLRWGQWLAVFLAALGVGYSILAVGRVPWIALGLAFSFGIYGLLRKVVIVKPVLGLAVETYLLSNLG
jgi:chloramphenicol-sensitive protein RarD